MFTFAVNVNKAVNKMMLKNCCVRVVNISGK